MSQEKQTTLTSLEKQIDVLATTMKHGFDAIDTRFEAIDERFDQMDEHFLHIDARLGLLERDVQDIRNRLTNLEHRVEVLVEHADGDQQERQTIKQEIAWVKERILALEAKVNK